MNDKKKETAREWKKERRTRGIKIFEYCMKKKLSFNREIVNMYSTISPISVRCHVASDFNISADKSRKLCISSLSE